MKHWKKIKSEDIFKNQWYHLRKDIVQLPDGKIIDDYYVSVRPEVVLVFALTPENEVLLVSQYKHGLGEVVTELPGGFFDKKEETAENAAKRELMEETGFVCSEIEEIAVLTDNPTKDTNTIHVFIAKNCRKTGPQRLDDTESIEVSLVPLKTIKDFILLKKIITSNSVAAVFMALEKLNKNS